MMKIDIAGCPSSSLVSTSSQVLVGMTFVPIALERGTQSASKEDVSHPALLAGPYFQLYPPVLVRH
jgi:hypothetical protein